MSNKPGVDEYLSKIKPGMSNRASRELAEQIFGTEGVPTWDWEAPRTKEGYFHFAGGVEPAIQRVKAFAPYADMLWLETKTPDVKQAQGFAGEIHKDFPGKWLVYNLSPSFNWSAHGYDGESRWIRVSRRECAHGS